MNAVLVQIYISDIHMNVNQTFEVLVVKRVTGLSI